MFHSPSIKRTIQLLSFCLLLIPAAQSISWAQDADTYTLLPDESEIEFNLESPTTIPSLNLTTDLFSQPTFEVFGLPKNGPETTFNDSNLYCHHRISLPALIIPAAGITYGFVGTVNPTLKRFNRTIKRETNDRHPNFKTGVDNYIQWSPAAAVLALDAFGVKGRHNFGKQIYTFTFSALLMGGTVLLTKSLTNERRPDNRSNTSFPSGHTATAFASAEWLRIEYGHYSPWIGIAGYAVATTTGALRIYNNRHWFSDVVAGAAIGYLSTHFGYVIVQWVENKIIKKPQKENFF